MDTPLGKFPVPATDLMFQKEDFVSVDQGDGLGEIPVAYWNTGRSSVKVGGAQILPGECQTSPPGCGAGR